jgi:hypothetical protein
MREISLRTKNNLFDNFGRKTKLPHIKRAIKVCETSLHTKNKIKGYFGA